ncbi:unnamed protein product [Polarella glacialis]|uniref:Fungal lipase-type domain-containing protein n=1 Tax=Polarella glacialis TaxID=89957 RepID=A0A813FH10_POLGL|nr:unnamed protein product [Polarella glacialis]CAE8688087.1 unnamed protein product [Polarella glacialis]
MAGSVRKLLAILNLGEAVQTLAYNQSIGLDLAYLEKAAYCGEDRFNRWDVGESVVKGFKVDASKVRFVADSSTQAAAGVGRMLDPPGCFVAMRGTNGPISSLLDAAFWLTDFGSQDNCPDCQVDFGFHRSYLSIKEGIFRALAEFGSKSLPLYLTGHSLGAAELSYLLFDALVDGYAVKHMYAMESPRPGNQAFAKALQSLAMRGKVDAWRIAHYQDAVVHLPPRGVLSYVHALPEIYYTSRNSTDHRICGLEEADCSNKWWPWQWTNADHSWYAQLNPCDCKNSTSALQPSSWII